MAGVVQADAAGNGPIAAFISILAGQSINVKVYDYVEHALGTGHDALAAAYVECAGGRPHAVGRRHRRGHLHRLAQGGRLGRQPGGSNGSGRPRARRCVILSVPALRRGPGGRGTYYRQMTFVQAVPDSDETSGSSPHPLVERIVDHSAIAHNIGILRAQSDAKLMAVVKADAFGHGAVEVSRSAIAAGAAWLGVATVDEALQLRRAGLTVPILAWLVDPWSDLAAAIGRASPSLAPTSTPCTRSRRPLRKPDTPQPSTSSWTPGWPGPALRERHGRHSAPRHGPPNGEARCASAASGRIWPSRPTRTGHRSNSRTRHSSAASRWPRRRTEPGGHPPGQLRRDACPPSHGVHHGALRRFAVRNRNRRRPQPRAEVCDARRLSAQPASPRPRGHEGRLRPHLHDHPRDDPRPDAGRLRRRRPAGARRDRRGVRRRPALSDRRGRSRWTSSASTSATRPFGWATRSSCSVMRRRVSRMRQNGRDS